MCSSSLCQMGGSGLSLRSQLDFTCVGHKKLLKTKPLLQGCARGERGGAESVWAVLQSTPKGSFWLRQL